MGRRKGARTVRLGCPIPLTTAICLVMIIDMSTKDMSEQRTDVPYGTLDLFVLKTLETMGEMNGYRIARRIEQVSGDALKLSQGAIYPALIRLEQEGWIRAKWGISETNRKVKFYSLTKAGAKQLEAEVQKWEQANALVARFLEAAL
jgi:PadR family transcriptional regulator